MTRITRLCRAVGVGLAVAAATLSMTQVAHAEPEPAPPSVPAQLVPPAGNKVYLVGHATGVQIYKCTGTSPNGTWTLLAPDATLVADNRDFVAKHFAGPTWQAKDGSSVVAARVDGGIATPDPSAIPWLLLKTTKTTPGRGGDRLVLTTYIQRVKTTGGLAPAGTCDPAVAKDTPVPYTADYFFWKKTGA